MAELEKKLNKNAIQQTKQGHAVIKYDAEEIESKPV